MTQAPLCLGILGAANIAHPFAEAVQGSAAIAVGAIASRSLANAKAFADRHQISKHYGSYQDLLDDAAVEAVYIPLPNHLHAAWAIKAMQAGKHVLCEKPLCVGRIEAEAMFAAAEENRVMLLEAYPYWFQPHMREMMKLVHGGVLGEIKTMQASFGFTIHKPEGNIRMSREKGGGALLDAGSYPVSLVCVVMGEAPLRVHASPVWSAEGADAGVDLSMLATLEFAGNRSAQFSCAMNVANHRHATIMGTAGTIETEYLNHTSAEVPNLLRVRRGMVYNTPFESIVTKTGSGFKFAAEAFAYGVRNNDQAAMEYAKRVSLDTAKTLEAIAKSARSGVAVTL